MRFVSAFGQSDHKHAQMRLQWPFRHTFPHPDSAFLRACSPFQAEILPPFVQKIRGGQQDGRQRNMSAQTMPASAPRCPILEYDRETGWLPLSCDRAGRLV